MIWTFNVTDDLNVRLQGKSNITSGFLDRDFLYDGNTYWVSTSNNIADIACFV